MSTNPCTSAPLVLLLSLLLLLALALMVLLVVLAATVMSPRLASQSRQHYPLRLSQQRQHQEDTCPLLLPLLAGLLAG